mgnify:CR=1 FL=1
MMTRTQRIGAALLLMLCATAALAPWLAPHRAGEQLPDRAYAPPTRVHVRDAGTWHPPFVYGQVLVDRLRREFREDTAVRVPLRAAPADASPVLLMGADTLGRDVFARLVLGARWSLGVTLLGACGAMLLGTLIGAGAAVLGGALERWLMRGADLVLVLPLAYLVLVLRALLPPVLSAGQVLWWLATLFALVAWPHPARGVRAIVASELARDYVEAARASGAGRWRLLRHVVPAAYGFLGAELVLLVPALLSAEAAISFLGLGFPEPTPSWGTMLQEAANVRVLSEAPWMLAPAVAMFLVTLALQLIGARVSTGAAFFDSLRAHGHDPT